VEDILVKYGLLSDDDCKIIADLHLVYSWVDKLNCWCVVEIDVIEDDKRTGWSQ
jgi:hypothetical protein